MDLSKPLYHRRRFPAEIISHCVWLYFRFCLSYRDVEEMMAGHRAYLHVARGEVTLNGQRLAAGDGAKIADEQALQLTHGKAAEILLFDLSR